MDNYDSLGGIVGGMIYGNVTISDCWFDGEIAVNSIQAAVGGIAGYIDGEVKNCLVATTDIGKDSIEEEANTCWVGYLGNGTVANNYWYTDDKYKATPLDEGVNKAAGTAVSDFKSADVLTGLQTNAGKALNGLQASSTPPLHGTREIFLRTTQRLMKQSRLLRQSTEAITPTTML